MARRAREAGQGDRERPNTNGSDDAGAPATPCGVLPACGRGVGRRLGHGVRVAARLARRTPVLSALDVGVGLTVVIRLTAADVRRPVARRPLRHPDRRARPRRQVERGLTRVGRHMRREVACAGAGKPAAFARGLAP